MAVVQCLASATENTLSEEVLVAGVDKTHLPHMLNYVLLPMPKAEHGRSIVNIGQAAVEFVMDC